MGRQTVLITGSTSGIGKATAIGLAKLNYKVILLSRNHEKLLNTQTEIIRTTGNKDIYMVSCDLSSQASIRKASDQVHTQFDVIDVLINNAGIHTSKLEFTEDGIEKTFATNHLAYYLLTGLLLDLIKNSKEGRIINVSSKCHNKYRLYLKKIINPKVHSKYPSYCRSKLANIIFTIELSNKLKSTNITVNSLHPGLIFTNIGLDNPDIMRKLINIYKRFFAGTSEEGAETSIYLAVSDEVKYVTGKYFVKKRIVEHSKQADDLELRKDLWDISERLTKYKYSF